MHPPCFFLIAVVYAAQTQAVIVQEAFCRDQAMACRAAGLDAAAVEWVRLADGWLAALETLLSDK